MSQKDSFEGLYPLLIFVVFGVVKALKARAKNKQEEKEKQGSLRRAPTPTPTPSIRKVTMPPSINIKKVKPVELSKVVKNEVFHRKKKSRIANLIGGLRSKKDLILLSEILVNKNAFK